MEKNIQVILQMDFQMPRYGCYIKRSDTKDHSHNFHIAVPVHIDTILGLSVVIKCPEGN